MNEKEIQLIIENQNKKIKEQNKKINNLEKIVKDFISREKQLIKCSEKIVYFTIEDANLAAERFKKKFGGKQHGYKCRTCHLYHITSK